MTTSPTPPSPLRAALLREETLDESKYEEYRMNLHLALNRAERRERITFHICWVSMLVAWGLSLVGGLRIIGSFDPYDPTATAFSVATGVIFVLACIVFPLSLASLHSRFRPRIHRIRQEIGTVKTGKLQRQIKTLQAPLGKQAE